MVAKGDTNEKLLAFVLLITIVFTGCTKDKNTNNKNEERLLVYVSFYPMYF